jgi:hypothetical protein
MMRTSHSLASALFISLAASACTRKGIQTALDSFFLTAITKEPLTLSMNVKITSNGYSQATLNSTSYANITWLERPEFKVQALDTIACQGARYTVSRQKNSTGGESPALVSLRIGLEDNDGPISEIEILNVINGSHILFNPDKFEQRTPPLFNSSQAFPPGASITNTTLLSRKEIISVANSYIEGVQAGKNALVKAGTNCPRISNGLQTSAHCDQGLQQFKWPVDNRRWIADTETGVAFGSMIFRGALKVPADTGDLINEFLAVKNGKIREIRAVMIYGKKDVKTVWPEDGTRSYNGL